MTARYSRAIATSAAQDGNMPGLIDEAKAEVRAHLSAVTTAGDDEEAHAHEVVVWVEDRDAEVVVHGEINAEPDAPYLREGFDPEVEATENPLSVEPETDTSYAEGGQP